MSKRLVVYCEGQTEQMFVERLLRNHLISHGIQVERAILAATALDPNGQRGGFINWPAIEADLRTEFSSDTDQNLRFTTLLDVYRMPQEVPGYPLGASGTFSSADIDNVEREIERTFGELRFKAYLQRYEFETLVLACPKALKSVFHENAVAIDQLQNNLAGFTNAEEINHGETTHPAARLETAIPGYGDLKASRAFWVLAEAGFDAVRAQCPRFNAWLSEWENWGDKG